MKAIKVIEPFKVEIVDVPKPVIERKDDVIIRITSGGICGSDIGIYNGTNSLATYPRLIGHEFGGIVTEVGEAVTAVKPGDKVAVDPVRSCGHCYACRIGRHNVCSTLEVMGVHRDGGFAEYVSAPESYVIDNGNWSIPAVSYAGRKIVCRLKVNYGNDELKKARIRLHLRKDGIDFTAPQMQPFTEKDNGGDLVETAFLMQALLCVHQYYVQQGGEQEKALAARIDKLWREVEWDWHRRDGQNVLYWHWSPEYAWQMNFPVRGYNECLIMYVLAAASPTHGVPAEVYHQGWAEGGAIVAPHEVEGRHLQLRYQGTEAGPLFWAHYSFLGLNPTGLKDQYCTNYFDEMRNLTLIHRAWCIRNPKQFKGYGADCWGLTASYSVGGYAAHAPNEQADLGVISPTAALSSIVYTPEESMQVMRHLYAMRDKVLGPYGFYDAFSETDDWYPQRYLAIDQGPIAVMLENHRSGLLWRLFMSHSDVQKGLEKLGFTRQ